MPTVFMPRTNGIHRGRAGDQGTMRKKLGRTEGLGDDPTSVGRERQVTADGVRGQAGSLSLCSGQQGLVLPGL